MRLLVVVAVLALVAGESKDAPAKSKGSVTKTAQPESTSRAKKLVSLERERSEPIEAGKPAEASKPAEAGKPAVAGQPFWFPFMSQGTASKVGENYASWWSAGSDSVKEMTKGMGPYAQWMVPWMWYGMWNPWVWWWWWMNPWMYYAWF